MDAVALIRSNAAERRAISNRRSKRSCMESETYQEKPTKVY
jgi:hypothetical protein